MTAWQSVMTHAPGDPPHAGEDDEPDPPWVAFPHMRAGDFGWRVEPGQGYLTRWAEWFYRLDELRRRAYLRRMPPPRDWYL